MPGEFRAAKGTNVEMVGRQSVRAAEGFSPDDAEVALMRVPNGRQPSNGFLKPFGCDHDIDVDDRLSGESRDGGAAHVLDTDCQVTKRPRDPRF